MKRFVIIILAAAFIMAGVTAASAQERKDRVVVRSKKGTTRASGRVIREDWREVTVDTDGDGTANKSFPIATVVRVEYGSRQPRYILQAMKLKMAPGKLESMLRRAYNDDNTPKFILQHPYHKLAVTYAERTRKDPKQLTATGEAYERLFRDIPNSRYAVTGRIDFGTLFLSLGKPDEAIRQYGALTTGTFGDKIARRGKLMIARVELSRKRFERAERLLAELERSTNGDGAEIRQEVQLLRARSLIGQQKYDDAYRAIERVVGGGGASKKVLGMAYSTFGDVFAAKKDYRTALTAYLKVRMMYPETDSSEKLHAMKQAVLMLERLGRDDEAAELKKQI